MFWKGKKGETDGPSAIDSRGQCGESAKEKG